MRKTCKPWDHITPHRGDDQLFWDRTNWQALCAHCHNSTKQRQERTMKPSR
ncbi:HNH endonuclease [Devosia pacifica]|uniref:HNH endonuclease n=1 Tax=Devosia pacifica TaxID=1335967 RepID=UPI00167AC2A9|nr:HNH endonuclease [Devosia pacifica]